MAYSATAASSRSPLLIVTFLTVKTKRSSLFVDSGISGPRFGLAGAGEGDRWSSDATIWPLIAFDIDCVRPLWKYCDNCATDCWSAIGSVVSLNAKLGTPITRWAVTSVRSASSFTSVV